MTAKYKAEGWKSNDPLLGGISNEYKVNYLARMLAGYDDETWNRLKPDRQRTYQRAASTLLHDRQTIEAQFAEWDAFEKLVAENNEQRRRKTAPHLEAEIEQVEQSIREDPRNTVSSDY